MNIITAVVLVILILATGATTNNYINKKYGVQNVSAYEK